MIFLSSSEFPELLIKIRTSFFVILPKSPWEQSLADIEKAGVPIDENVDAILDAIKPLLPTPTSITLDWQFAIASTALLKDELIFFF